MKRKTLAVSLSAILAASMLFGCGSNSKSGDTKSSSDNGSASASAADASNAGSDASGSGIQYDGDDVTITYWHTHGDSEEEVLVDTIIPEFEKQYPNIHVDAVRMPYIAVICDWVVFCNIIDYIFQPDEGSLVNYCLTTIGILKEPVAWLQNTWTGNFVIWICSIWKGYGWVMIIYTAGLLGIPSDQYEAATMDGANAVQKFFHVTLPGLRGTTLYLLINLINGAMNIFIQVFLLTKGDPLGTTDVVMDYIYRRAFNYFDFGYAAACGIVMGIVVFAISMGLKRFLRYGENL